MTVTSKIVKHQGHSYPLAQQQASCEGRVLYKKRHKGQVCDSVLVMLLQHLHEVLTAAEAGRDSDINNSMENIMPRVKLIDASLKVS